MKSIVKVIVGLMVAHVALANTPITVAPVSIKVANDQQAKIDLSNEDINRVFVQGDKISSFNAPNRRMIAHNDQSGSIYMNVYGKSPFTAFVTTHKGRHFSLLVIPKSEPGMTVQFIPTSPVAFHYVNHRLAAKRFEQSTPYEKTLVNLLRETMLQNTPAGYSVISSSNFKSIPIFVVPKYFNKQKLVSEQVVAGFLGGELAVRVIKVRNRSRHSISLYANDFYRPGVRAVAIAHELIPPRQSTDVYEVISNA